MKVVRNISWVVGGQGLTSIMAFIKGILLARLLGVEMFGLYGVVVAYVTIINQLIDFRINETVIRYLSKYLATGENTKIWPITRLCYGTDFLTGVLALGIMVGTSGLAETLLLKKAGAAVFVQLYAVVLFMRTVEGTSLGIIHVFGKFGASSILTTFYSALDLTFVAVILAISPSLTNVFRAMIGSAIIYGVMMNVYALWILKREHHGKLYGGFLSSLKGELREIALFAFNTSITSTLKVFAANVDLILLGYFRGTRDVGVYKIAASLVSALYLPVASAVKVIYPRLSRLVSEGNYDLHRKYIKYAFIWAFSYGIIGVSALWFVGEGLIVLLYGREYLYGYNLFRIMALGIPFGLMLSMSRPVLLSVYDTVTNNISLLAMGIIWLGLAPILIIEFGVDGAAATFVAATLGGAAYSTIKAAYAVRRKQTV